MPSDKEGKMKIVCAGRHVRVNWTFHYATRSPPGEMTQFYRVSPSLDYPPLLLLFSCHTARLSFFPAIFTLVGCFAYIIEFVSCSREGVNPEYFMLNAMEISCCNVGTEIVLSLLHVEHPNPKSSHPLSRVNCFIRRMTSLWLVFVLDGKRPIAL